MEWALRYTSHLGYLPPEFRPQFEATLGSTNLRDHIRYAAELGFAGVLYPWAVSRPEDEVAEVAAAVKEKGLVCSTIVCVPLELHGTGIWADRTPASRDRLATEAAKAARVAVGLGSDILAAIISKDVERSDEEQWDDVVANYRELSAIAGDHGLKLATEPMIVLENTLLRTITEAVAFVRDVDHPAAGIIYDTGHVSSAGEDLLTAFTESYDKISLIQFADQPGRVEPGAGKLDIVAVASEAVRRGYRGLVDLEHGWSEVGIDGERTGLERLRTFDAAVKQAAPHR